MTELGESVAITTINVDDVEDNHYVGIFLCYPNGKPYTKQISFDAKVDGTDFRDITNLESEAMFCMLPPGASAEFTLQDEKLDPDLDETRQGIKKILDEIIEDEREEKERMDRILAESGALERSLILVGAFMTGVGEGAVGIIEFVGDTLETAGKVMWFNFQSQANVLEAAWEKFVEGDEQAFFDSVEEKNVKDFADAFGATPAEMRHAMAEAYKIMAFIMEDAEVKDMLMAFAKDYASAQAKTEYAEMAGSAAFDLILAAILAVFTGGAGNAAQVAAKVKHASKLKTLAKKLIKFTDLSERKRLPKTVKGTLDEKKKVEVKMPAQQKMPTNKVDNNIKAETDKRNGDLEKKKEEREAKKQENAEENGQSNTDSTNESTGQTESGDTSQCSSKTCKGGEPISLVTGEELLELTDFSFDAPLPLSWTRVYRSSNPHNLGLGHGWTHPFAERLELDKTEVKLHDAEGRVISFNTPAIGKSCTNTAEKIRLYRKSLTSFVVSSVGPGPQLHKHFEAISSNSTLHLNSIRDVFGNSVKLYYKDNRITSIESQGNRWVFAYNKQLNISDITWHTSQGNSKVLARYTYDDREDLVKAQDAAGNAEHYAFQNHLITKRTLKSGYSFYFQWDGTTSKARCIKNWGDKINGQPIYDYTFKWDPANKRVAMTDTRGGTEYYQFNDRGLPVFTKDPEGGEVRQEYDALGNVTKVIDPNGHAESFAYNADDLLQSVIDKNGLRRDFIRDSKGNITQVIDPMGNAWKRQYNLHGQVVSQTNPEGQSTQYSYNAMGLINGITDPLGRQWHYVWDNTAKLIAIKNPQGQHTRYSYGGFGELLKITWPDGQNTEYRYDDNGNCTAIKQPDGKVEQFKYNSLGLLTHHKDSGGRLTEYRYNGLSQVVERKDPAGQSLQYHYDGERNLVGLTNEKGEHYRLRYDLNERLTEEVGFDGRIQRYRYNASGHLLASEDYTADGVTCLNRIEYRRDGEGRLLQQIDANKQDVLSAFEYDSIGRLTQAQNNVRTLRWKYDNVGRVVEDWQDQNIIKHSYDAAGTRVQTVLPNGEDVHYHYDNVGAFVGLDYKGQRIADIKRDVMGRELSRSLSNTLTTEQRFDPQGRLIAQRTGKANADAPFKAISQRRYQYNDRGQLAQIDDQIRGATRYHYDAIDRLTKVEGPNPETFVHDPAGNILSASNDSGEPQAAQVKGNRLAFFGDTHYQYDHLGNRIGQARGKNQSIKTTYRYNAQNQLTDVMHKNVHTQYSYDALGRRISKSNAQSRTDFLWLEDVLLSEHTQTQNAEPVAKTYLFEPGTFKPLAFVQGDECYHYHLDHLGTPQEITNSQGQIVWAVSYKAYGNLAVAHRNHVENNLRFQGQYFDVETGLHYNRFRYYDPGCGRFVNQDPIGLVGGSNNYQYAPNPVGWVDPFGLKTKDCTPKRSPDDIAAKYGGKKIGENRYQMPDRKSAQQAASEISGDLGSNPKTIRRKDYIDSNNTYQQNQSNRVIGKHSESGNAGYHDHSIGHSRFDETRPHFNAWSESTGTTAKDNVHLYY